MKALNTKIINLESAGDISYFMIDCGRFGQMIFSFEVDWILSDNELEDVVITLDKYDWECEEYREGKFLNDRNTKMICEYLEEIVFSDPEHFGFDYESLIEEFEPDFEEHYYKNREENY
jgi:hypothetical protein